MEGKETEVTEPVSSTAETAEESNSIPKQQGYNKLVLVGVTVTVIVGVIIALVILVFGGKSEEVRHSTAIEESSTPTEIITEPDPTVTYSNKTCTENSCHTAAMRLLEYMNSTVKPCDDFYHFACGMWMKKHPLKGTEVQNWVLDEMYDNYKQKISNLLKNPISDKPPKHMKILKTQYDTCVNTGTNVTVGLKYLQDALKKLGGWPVMIGQTWKEEKFDYLDALTKIYEMGLGQKYLFEFSIGPHIYRMNQYVIIIGKPKFAMDEEFYDKTRENENMAQYIKKIKSTALQFGDISDKDEELKQIYKFEFDMFQELKKDQSSKQFVKLDTYVNPKINLQRFVKDVITDVEIPKNQILEIDHPEYMNALASLIRRTKQKTVANYLIWRVLQENEPFLEKSNDCELFIQENLGIACSSMYVRSYFNEDMRKSASVVASYVRNAIMLDLKNVKWMTKYVIPKAQEKLNNTAMYFPFVAELLNVNLIDHYYENLTFSNISLFMNLINIRKWQAHTDYKKLETQYDFRNWEFHVKSTQKDVFLNVYANSIYSGFSALQDPAYGENLPMYLNFGGVGNLIGQAIAAGITDYGMNTTKDATLKPWWDYETRDMYKKSTKCLDEQYGAYTFPGSTRHVNANATRSRNVAEHLGFIGAYYAYLKWEKENKIELKLPGLNYTPRQLFWINLANTFCCNYDTKIEKIFEESWVPCIYRVNGALSNYKEFSTDFNCYEGTSMNRRKKCKIHEVP